MTSGKRWHNSLKEYEQGYADVENDSNPEGRWGFTREETWKRADGGFGWYPAHAGPQQKRGQLTISPGTVV
jgi:hypothetical protein